MDMTKLLKVNIFFAVVYAAAFFLAAHSGIFAAFKLASGLAIILLAGVNFACLLKIIFKKDFDIWEILSFSFLGIFLFYPLLLLIEFVAFGRLFYFFPVANFLAILVILFFIATKKSIWDAQIFSTPEIKIKRILTSPLFIVFILNLSVVIAIFSAYQFLPDKDPFKWTSRLSRLFGTNSLSATTYRPFFSAITYIFVKATGLEIFRFFKYIFPFLSLSVLLPIWLVAEKVKDRRSQILLLLASLISPNAILYSQTAMPQAFAIFLAFFFIFFLLKYHQEKDLFYYFSAGAIALLAIFFHEIFAAIFLVWLLATIFVFRKNVLASKRDAIYLLVILLSNFSIVKLDFVKLWTGKILNFISTAKINFYFPARYTNIDGNRMGWSGITGITKFYSYYIGPFLLLLFLLIIVYIFKKASFRQYLKNELKHKAILILAGCFLVFFAISEIMPRFPGVALLPDRAWIFGAIFAIVFLFLLIDFWEKQASAPKKIQFLLLLFLTIGIGGALFINAQKRFLVTGSEINSAIWIRKNLPSEKTLFSSTGSWAARYYSQSEFTGIPERYYYDDELLKRLDARKNSPLIDNTEFYYYAERNAQNAAAISDLVKDDVTDSVQSADFSKIIKNSLTDSRSLLQKISSASKTSAISDNVYIYYSEKSPKNPYLGRPYEIDRKNNPKISDFIFDEYPEKFERIYENHDDGKAIIWKAL